MGKTNCWDFKKCSKADCPARTDSRLTGVHGGQAGGRACWVVKATLCRGEVQGSFAQKLPQCMACEFYKQVTREEGAGVKQATEILGLLR